MNNSDDLPFLKSGGEMGERIRRFDWVTTPLGRPHAWRPALKAMVRIALTTQHPIFIFWGPDHICLYNDAYSASLGPEKHPGILGMKGRDAWPEIWPVIGPQIDLVLRGEGATWHENQHVPILRHGELQDVYWTYSYGPIDDDTSATGVGGILVICTETTRQVLDARRVATERERLAQLFEQAPGFMCMLTGPEHRFELANPAYMRLLAHRDIIGRTVSEAVPEAAGQGLVELLDGVYRSGKAVTGAGAALTLANADGELEEHVIDFVYQPITDEAGAVVGIFVEGSDATQRARVDEALRQSAADLRVSEQQLRLATEAAEIGLWDVDLVSDTLFWPPLVKAMFGISADVPISMDDFYAGLHPQDAHRVSGAFDAAIDPVARAPYDVEYRTVGKEDGRVRWVAAKGRGFFDEQQRCVRVLGTAIDVSRRKADEARLHELNETLEQRVAAAVADKKLLSDIVEGTDIFVLVFDLNFRLLAVNRASQIESERIYGIRPAVGDNMLDLLDGLPEQRADVAALWSRALAGEEFTTVHEFGDPARDRRHYEIRFNTLRDRDGSVIGAYQFVNDVTERLRDQQRLARAEESMRQAQKMEAVGQLTGGIAHDFNNVLQAVRGSLQLIRRASPDERVVGWADTGLRSIKRGAELTSQLLTFAREQKLELKAVCVSKLVEDMQEMIRRSIGPLIRLNIEVADRDTFTLSDVTQLEMAVLNLAINGRDAMPDGGSLSISVRHRDVQDHVSVGSGTYVQIQVQDTGVGMPADVAARAFEPFFTTKGVGKGSGLGLSQVYGLVRQAGGSAQIESEPGRGTTVSMLLPRVEPAPPGAPTSESALAGAQSERSRILVVDDDLEVRTVVVDSLRALGYDVTAAEDGPAGLRALEDAEHDLIVVDFAMPGMTGAEVATRARALRPGLPILFASGYANTTAIEAAMGPSISILRKPFEIAELESAIVALLVARAAARSL